MTWIRVSHDRPCPICKKPDWCGFTADGRVAICMRVQSERQAKNGGWVHWLKDRIPARRPLPPPPRRVTDKLFSISMYFAALRERWDDWLTGEFALDLGVDGDQLARLEPCYDYAQEAFAFPMRDVDGEVTGIRLRGWDGRKWAVRGSKDGLFCPVDAEYPGRELVICEGPTDTAAALTAGIPAVGRSSCTGGAGLLKEYCSKHRISKVTIVSDNDSQKQAAGGYAYRPGRQGAMALGQQLGRMFRVVTPQKKDLRDWVHSGISARVFWTVADAQEWGLPTL